jgi:hypothetical protein
MTKSPTRILVHLGSGEEGEHRQAALLAAAESVGAIGQRGPSVSTLLQMIADNQLEITMATIPTPPTVSALA